jgi:hypothetical protein
MLENLQKTLQNIVSFKCLKNKKNKLNSSDSKTRNFTLSEYIYIISSYIIFAERFWFKKSGLREKKHAIFLHGPFNSELIVLSTWINHIRQSCGTTLKKKIPFYIGITQYELRKSSYIRKLQIIHYYKIVNGFINITHLQIRQKHIQLFFKQILATKSCF